MAGSSSSQGTAGRVNRRAVPGRGLAWVCWGIAALLAAGSALGLMASGAVAGQVPVILQYSCKLPVVGGTALTASFVWPSGLQTAMVGTRTPSLPVAVTATVASAARTVVSFAGIEWIEGTADVSADIIAPQGDISEKVKLSVPRTNVSTGSGPLTVPASGRIPSVLLSQTGQATVVVGAVVIHLATLTASGTLSVLGNISVSCALDSGQSGLVSSVQILPVASPTARPGSATQPAPTPTPTPTPTRTSTATHSPTPAPSPSPSAQNALVKLLHRSAPFARSFPGFVLLALFLVCAAVLVILKAALRIFKLGLAVRNPSAKRSPPG
jgi:hypothetical protein